MATTDLDKYRAKRSTQATPEPFGSARPIGGNVFVVHHHLASHEHFDLRLEVGGVLWSWAVPRGPHPDPAVKRMAIKVENHPIDYGWFEDRIPEGNYGAGVMIIWDRGRWVPKIDPVEGFADGKLLFELKGFKLHGTWTLVKTKNRDDEAGNQWLLIKERDQWAGPVDSLPMRSVVSGLTAHELKGGHDRVAELQEELDDIDDTQPMPDSRQFAPMLCELSEPFSDPDWLFEVKYDGYRVIIDRSGDKVRLLTRSGRDVAGSFPEITEAALAMPYPDFVMDGEVVAHDPAGLPDFQRLQQRGMLSRASDISRATITHPVHFYAFDLLGVLGKTLVQVPLDERKELLHYLVPEPGYIRYVDHVPKMGEALFAQAQSLGLEGLVAKRADSKYVGTRSPNWLKIPVISTDRFAIVGLADQKNQVGSLGALYLAAHDGQDWVSVGKAGSGLNEERRDEILSVVEDVHKPVVDVPDAPNSVRWVKPTAVVEVRYKAFTNSGNLRQPVIAEWLGPKPEPEMMCRTGPWSAGDQEPEVVEIIAPVAPQKVIFSNRDKIFWPKHGYTKGDLIDYYRKISQWMLPYLKDRPVVLTRYPDGIDGKSFYQHRAPDFLPQWIRRETIWNEGDQEEREYIIIDDEDTLLYLANLGTIPIHMWSARIDTLQRPDWCILDLDPKSASYSDVVKVAKTIHAICEEVELPHYLKTSGATGLHILIPTGGQLTHDQARSFSELIARICVARIPEIATIERNIELRAGRVYVDYLQNGQGKTIAATFCARHVEAGSVSMPMRWGELKASKSPSSFTLKSAPRRMAGLKEDPMVDLLDVGVDIGEVFSRLASLG